VHGRNREREEDLKLECGGCAHCRGVNIVILNWLRPLWERDSKVVVKSGKDEPVGCNTHVHENNWESLCIAAFISN
jgi:hypothetical protein